MYFRRTKFVIPINFVIFVIFVNLLFLLFFYFKVIFSKLNQNQWHLIKFVYNIELITFIRMK